MRSLLFFLRPPLTCFCGWFAFPEWYFETQAVFCPIPRVHSLQLSPHTPPSHPPISALGPPECSCGGGGRRSHASDPGGAHLPGLGWGLPAAVLCFREAPVGLLPFLPRLQ